MKKKIYIKMKEINDNQSIIGLLPEEVVGLLGKTRYEYYDRENKKVYNFSAGKMVEKTFLGNISGIKYYELIVHFDENNKVEDTYIKLST